jgi:threonine dehydrogenase-like Zn-dependent dehydrogenase
MERGIRLYWESLLKQVQSGALDPLQMVLHRVRLEDMEHVYHAFDAKDNSMQKIFEATGFSFARAADSPDLKTY